MAINQTNRDHSDLFKRIDEMQINPSERERAKALLLRAFVFAETLVSCQRWMAKAPAAVASVFGTVPARLTHRFTRLKATLS